MVRHLFWPDEESRYAGYVCWRGFVLEQECPRALTEFIGNRFTLYQVGMEERRTTIFCMGCTCLWGHVELPSSVPPLEVIAIRSLGAASVEAAWTVFLTAVAFAPLFSP